MVLVKMSEATFQGIFDELLALAKKAETEKSVADEYLLMAKSWLGQLEPEQTERGHDAYAMWIGAYAMYNTFCTIIAAYLPLLTASTIAKQPAVVLMEWARQIDEQGGLQPMLDDELLERFLNDEGGESIGA